MPRTKKRDAQITVAIIAGIATVVGAYVASPYFASLYQDRPIVDISLGYLGSDLPKNEVQNDGKYYLEFVTRNRGNDDGRIIITLQGTGTKIFSSATTILGYIAGGTLALIISYYVISYYSKKLKPSKKNVET